MKRSQEKQVKDFLAYVLKLEVIEAIGIARLLKVDLITRPDESDADEQPAASIQEKEFDILLSEMIDAFISSPKETRKWILQLMKDATAKV